MTLNAGDVRINLKVITAGARAEIDKVMRSIDRLGEGTKREARTMKTALMRVQKALDKVGDESERTRRRSNRALGAVGRTLSRLKGFAIAAATAMATIGGALVIRSLIDARFQFDAINSIMLAATGTARNAADALDFVRSNAMRLGLDLRASADGFARLAAAARNTTLEGQGVRDIFTGIAEVAAVMQMNTEQVNGTIRAFEQIISKGVVSAEELRRQLGDRIPGAFQIAANAMDVTTSRLQEMLEQGELVSTEFLPRFAAELRERFAPGVENASQTFRASVNRMGTAWLELRNIVGEHGFIDSLAESLGDVSALIQDPAFIYNFAQAMQALGDVITFVTGSASLFMQTMESMVRLLPGGALLLETSFGNAFKNTGEIARDVVDDLQSVNDQIGSLTAERARLQADLERFGNTALSGFDDQAIASIDRQIAALEQRSGDLTEDLDLLRDAVTSLIRAGQDVPQDWLDALEIDPQLIQLLDDFDLYLRDIGESSGEAEDGLGDLSTELERFVNRIRRDVTTEVEDLQSQLALLDDAQVRAALSAEELRRAEELLTHQLEEAEKAAYRLENNLDKLDEAQERVGEKIKEAADEMQEVFEKRVANMQGAFEDFFADVFDDGRVEWGDLLDDIWQSWTRMLANMAAQALAKPIIIPMVQALTGGGGSFGGTGGAGGGFGGAGGAGGGIMGLLGSLGGGLSGLVTGFQSAGLGQLGIGLGQALGFTATGAGSMLSFLGSAGLNAPFGMIGSLLGGALGLGSGSQLQDSIGGGVGGLVGGGLGGAFLGAQLGMFAGPIGAILGGLAGVAISGLFGSDKDYPSARNSIGTSGGLFAITGNKTLDGGPTQEVQQVAQAAVDSLNLILQALGATVTGSIDVLGSIGYLGAGGRPGAIGDAGYFGGLGSGVGDPANFARGADFQGIDDVDEAVRQAIVGVLEAAVAEGVIDGISESDIQRLATADDLEAALAAIVGERELPGALEDLFRQLTDPLGYVLEQLLQAQKARRDQFESLGLLDDILRAQLDEVEKLEIDQVFAQFGSSIEDISEAFARARERIDAFLGSLDAGPNSVLAPLDQLANAQAQFDAILAAAQGGNIDAINSITDIAGVLLDIARDVFASTDSYFDIEGDVRDALSGLASPEAEQAAIEAELARQTEILEEIRDVLYGDVPGQGGIGGGGGGGDAIGGGIGDNDNLLGGLFGGVRDGGGGGRGGGIGGVGGSSAGSNTSDIATSILDATLRETSATSSSERQQIISLLAQEPSSLDTEVAI